MVNFVIYIADRKANTCIQAHLFVLRFVNPQDYHWYVATHSIRLHRRVVSWVNYSSQRTKSFSEPYTPVISACWRLMGYDVKISGARIWTHDLWIRKRACYPMHYIDPYKWYKYFRWVPMIMYGIRQTCVHHTIHKQNYEFLYLGMFV